MYQAVFEEILKVLQWCNVMLIGKAGGGKTPLGVLFGLWKAELEARLEEIRSGELPEWRVFKCEELEGFRGILSNAWTTFFIDDGPYHSHPWFSR
jgi:hypothetical protein